MKQHTVYTVTYFIDKFEKIPNNLWCDENLHDGVMSCTAGHCGVFEKDIDGDSNFINPCEEASALGVLLKPLTIYAKPYEVIWNINDGFVKPYSKLPTPKQRILAALYDIRAMIEPKAVAHNRIGSAPSELTKIDVGDRIDVMREKVDVIINEVKI